MLNGKQDLYRFLDKYDSFGTPVWKELALFARIIGYKEGFCRK
jgi:hypothetical protein